MQTRKNSKSFLYVIVLTIVVASSVPVWAVEGVLSKESLGEGNYCHMKFPAIRPSTLGSDHPALKSSSSADVIDYSGPCDHDPLGKEEILRQKEDRQLFRDHRQG